MQRPARRASTDAARGEGVPASGRRGFGAQPRVVMRSRDVPTNTGRTGVRRCRGAVTGRRGVRRGADEAAPLSGHSRRAGRVQLRRRSVVRVDRRGPGHAPDGAPGAGAVSALLARRLPNRLHGPVRRRRAGVRHPGRGRRAAPVDVLPGARPPRAALGLRQPGVRLGARRPFRPVPVAALQHGSLRQPALPRRARRRPAGAVADAGIGRRRPVAGRHAGGLLTAVPGLPHVEAVRGRMGAGAVHLRPRDARGGARDDAPAGGSGSDVDWQRDLLHVRPDRDAQSVFVRPWISGDRTPHR